MIYILLIGIILIGNTSLLAQTEVLKAVHFEILNIESQLKGSMKGLIVPPNLEK
jgi:hypothetical protein